MKKKQAKQNKPISKKNVSSSTKLPAINQKKQSIQSNHLSINISSYQDQGLITLIQQYLLKNNLFDTLETFHKDCLKGFKTSIKSIDALKKQLLQSFDGGNRDLFEARFRQYVPLSMRSKDVKTLRIQFYLELYFFVYSIHPYLGRKKMVDSVSKQHFVSFLEGKGALLSKQQQFLPFYALAYVPKPQEHQSFKSIFTKQWISDLRKEFSMFLQRLYPNTKTPLIVSIYEKFIEMNLQMEKYSSAGLTEPDQQLGENMIQEQIQQHLQESIINNPQPVLLENHNFNQLITSNKVSNNSIKISKSLDKAQKSHHVQQNLHASFIRESSEPIQNQDLQQLIQLRQKTNEFEQQRASLLSYIETMKKKYQSLQNDFKQNFQSIKIILQESQNKWFKLIQQIYNVALDVYNAALNLNNGIPLSDPQLLPKRGEKLERYKGFVSMNIQDLLSDNIADYSLFERPQNDLSMDLVKKNTQYIQKDQKLIQIDFDKIKAILSSTLDSKMSEQDIAQLQFQKCLILQALRWRMTRIRGAFQKREVVLSYTRYDVLEIRSSQEKGNKSIINILLNSNNQTILHQTALFISALGIDYYGRDYLFNNELMVKMMELRKMPNLSEMIKGIILVIFQMLSNKRACQAVMIDNGLMEEIIEVLDKERDQMAPFIMEYTTALLLNLLLNKKGLDRAQRIRSQILMTLINLMQTQHASVKSFVHASLYPLLARKFFRQKALQFGMQANIKYLLQNNPSVEVQHQLGYVYNRLMLEEDVDEDKEDEPEYDEINDEEIGEDAQLISEDISSPLSGQLLLIKKYALTGPNAMQQMVQLREEVRQTFSKSIYYDRDVYERYSVQTPLLGRGRKSQILPQKAGFTHNNSVYSSKSSNRILRSEKNSRIKNISQQPEKQKNQIVPQKFSQQSKREYPPNFKEQNKNNNKLSIQLFENNSFEKQTKPNIIKKGKIQIQKSQQTFRKMGENDSLLKDSLGNQLNQQSIPINQSGKFIIGKNLQNNKQVAYKRGQDNEEGNNPNEQEGNLRSKLQKPNKKNEDYEKAFQTRALLVRTPPQKTN